MEITINHLRNLLIAASEIGAKKALIECGEIKPTLNQSEAYRMFGQRKVERWVKQGLIEGNKDGRKNSQVRYDRRRLEELSISSNRATYLTTDQKLESEEI